MSDIFESVRYWKERCLLAERVIRDASIENINAWESFNSKSELDFSFITNAQYNALPELLVTKDQYELYDEQWAVKLLGDKMLHSLDGIQWVRLKIKQDEQ